MIFSAFEIPTPSVEELNELHEPLIDELTSEAAQSFPKTEKKTLVSKILENFYAGLEYKLDDDNLLTMSLSDVFVSYHTATKSLDFFSFFSVPDKVKTLLDELGETIDHQEIQLKVRQKKQYAALLQTLQTRHELLIQPNEEADKSDLIFGVLDDLLKGKIINLNQAKDILKIIRPYEVNENNATAEQNQVNALWQAMIDNILPLTTRITPKWPDTESGSNSEIPFSSLTEIISFFNDEEQMSQSASAVGILPLCFKLKNFATNTPADIKEKKQLLSDIDKGIDNLKSTYKHTPLIQDKFALVKDILHALSHLILVGVAIGIYNRKNYGTYFKSNATQLTQASAHIKNAELKISQTSMSYFGCCSSPRK